MNLQTIQLAITSGVDGIRGNLVRTTLSTVGVLIGVASLVGVLAMGDGMERYVRDAISKERVQVVRVTARTTLTRDGRQVPIKDPVVFSPDHVSDVRHLPGVADATLWIAAPTTFRRQGHETRQVLTIATLSNGADFDFLEMLMGRYFIEAEVARNIPVIVVSSALADSLSQPLQSGSLLGRWIQAGGRAMRVVGIYRGKVPQAYVPLPGAASAFAWGSRPPPPALLVRSSTIEGVDQLKTRLIDWSAARFGHPDQLLDFSTYRDRIEQASRGIGVFKVVMGAIVGISLVVGGIGVMNVLLASVAERTREIGVRRALGARRSDVMIQFLFESVAITGLGSLAGLLLGTGGAIAMGPLVRTLTHQDIHTYPGPMTLITAMICPIAIGIVFGVYPALRAARLAPIHALHHE